MSGWGGQQQHYQYQGDGDADTHNKRSRHEEQQPHSLAIAAKRQHVGDVNPAREYLEPKLYQQPVLSYGDGEGGAGGPKVRCFVCWHVCEVSRSTRVHA
jgi:hypothetical protein